MYLTFASELSSCIDILVYSASKNVVSVAAVADNAVDTAVTKPKLVLDVRSGCVMKFHHG